MSELSTYELETQHGELLPEREALSFFSIANVVAVNAAAANQVLTAFSANAAVARQVIVIG